MPTKTGRKVSCEEEWPRPAQGLTLGISTFIPASSGGHSPAQQHPNPSGIPGSPYRQTADLPAALTLGDNDKTGEGACMAGRDGQPAWWLAPRIHVSQ